MSDLRSVLKSLGGVFLIVGFVSLIALVVPLYFGEYGFNCKYDGITPLLITSGVFFGFGLLLYYVFKKADPPNFKSAMVTAALAWLFVPLISTIPFLLITYNGISHLNFLSGFFESMSGWSGTGLTIVPSPSKLPYTLQFWRTIISWVGGVGVIILTLSILAIPGTGSYVLYKGEAREQKTHPSLISTARMIWKIFLIYTIIGVIVVIIIGYVTPDGMNPWQSLNHAMTALATGGFSVTDDGMTSFGTVSQMAIVVLMLIGAIAFVAHYDLFKGRIKKFFSDTQLKAMIVIVIVGVIGLTIFNLNLNGYAGNLLGSLKISGFQFVSALTCTGQNTVMDLYNWSEVAKLILSIAMILGGAAGSTAGGIKLFRVVLLYKGVGWKVKRAISSPRRVFVHKLGDKSLSKEEAMDLINEAAIISFMWIILLIAGVIIIIQTTGANLSNSFFEVCSAQGNVGLTAGITKLDMNYIAKATLIFNMWIGRLEIIPVIVLIRSIAGIKRNLR